MARKKFKSMDEYIESSSAEAKPLLEKIRSLIAKKVPSAEESISYNIPAFKGKKTFVYFAAFKSHIGMYPPVKDKELRKKLKPYMNEKGNLSFPIDEKLPLKVIGDVVKALWNQYEE